MMKKRLFSIFGPLICAAVLLGVLFLSPWKIDTSDPKILAQAATAMNDSVFRGDMIKNEAIETGKYVPFFGSSELNRVSATHPSVLAQKYNRDYTPFLLGAPGTQSLTQYGMIKSMAKELAGKKAVFIISPQWFTPKGVNEQYFNNYYSEQHVYKWLTTVNNISEADKYYARRLLEFPKVKNNQLTVDMLKQIQEGKLPTETQKAQIDLQLNLFDREDELFSGIGLGKNLADKIDHFAQGLPAKYDFNQLISIANKEGRADTTNNSLGIKNTFYASHLQSRIEKMKNSQKDWDYRYGPEYSDFQLVLDEFAKNQVEVLFIIPPINQKWMDYTGLPKEVLTGFDKKIRYQLTSQGFTNIADLTTQGNVDYFMEDTIHMGWRGWLAADEYIKPFMETKTKVKPTYKMDERFLSEDWQKEAPVNIEKNE
ncbi:D-alanyl-lipoteichoic acid biosynthesis protein DltD [Enterococcus phoeniculicola]|jgi:D-alanine transfer protein|uniref:Protein DltD n=2 Tax=Enterococcus phoeniculicola TaxID=154621 RepID=R3W638_9ENTE|nr:D-alanyl-lipoteichoic acid biosynthesis protein DltD [Enterococcus phoeniculicola ATCC BAA-412]EOT76486.1 D-alanyl-lipoteichoic acid biosynthesis protein DltD [Enterococcus phoeniculicola ATCC BAA-412]OJG71103.1 D-alanyl-lipoteichoic acid biosynthesis protein DltD [Enterococcus phoeniculicola]